MADTSTYRIAPSVAVQTIWGAHRRLAPHEGFDSPSPYASQQVYALWLVLSGEVEVATSERRFSLRGGDVFLHTTSQTRHVATLSGAEWLSVGLQVTLPGSRAAFPEGEIPATWRPDAPGMEDMAACMGVLARDMQGVIGAVVAAPTRPASPGALDPMLRESLGRALFCLAWRQWAGARPDTLALLDAPGYLDRALRLLQTEPQSSVQEMARAASLSVAQFRRQFHRWFGMAPHRYIDQHRIGLARHLLASTTLSVTEVATRSGFDNSAHFSRAFKSFAGVPPSQYRRMMRDGARL